MDHDGSVTSSSLSLPQFALSESLGSLGDDPSSPSSEGRISGDGVEVVQAADGVASELPTAGNVDSAANESPWGRFSCVERAQLGFPELDPDDTLDFLGYGEYVSKSRRGRGPRRIGDINENVVALIVAVPTVGISGVAWRRPVVTVVTNIGGRSDVGRWR